MSLTARIRHSARARGLFALLLVCVLAIRVAIPTGFMPTQSAHGIVISLCTGQGAVKAFLPIEQKPDHGSGHHGAADGPCAFAAGLGGPLLDTPSLLLPVAMPVPRAPSLTRAIADLTFHRLAAPPPPSQGPPARG